MKVRGISEIALPQILRGFLHRVAKAIEITTIVAIEEIVMSAITTTFVTTIVGGEFRFPPHEGGGGLLGVQGGGLLGVLPWSAGVCKGTIEGSLSCQGGRLVDRDWRQLMTAQYRPSITESFQARLTRLGGNQGRMRGKDRR